jgi:hypothetical protein
MSGTFIDDIVSSMINAAIAAAHGSEGEGQDAAALQHEMQIMVHATRSTKYTRMLHPHFLCTLIFGDFCG